MTHAEAAKLIEADPRNQEAIFPVINGQEANNNPTQSPGRSIINFFDWTVERASTYSALFDIVRTKVKPERDKVTRAARRDRWWQYAERAAGLYSRLVDLERCFMVTGTTKHLNFSASPTSRVFLQNVYVFTTDRWDLYAVVQSTLHEIWARKYSGALETRLHYTPTDCYLNYPFPVGLWQTTDPSLATLGERYHEHRRALMKSLWLGLTDIYNLFHTRDLTPAEVARVSKKPLPEAETGYQGIIELRYLHRELDIAVRDAYGWTDLDLGHDFVEVETLPENDRVRHTISPPARKEVLKRLLAENHRRAALQIQAALAAVPAKKARGKKTTGSEATGDLF